MRPRENRELSEETMSSIGSDNSIHVRPYVSSIRPRYAGPCNSTAKPKEMKSRISSKKPREHVLYGNRDTPKQTEACDNSDDPALTKSKTDNARPTRLRPEMNRVDSQRAKDCKDSKKLMKIESNANSKSSMWLRP